MRQSNLLKNFFSIADEAFYNNNVPSFFYETTKLENSIEVEMILPGYTRKELSITSDNDNLLVETNENFKESKWKIPLKRAFKLSENLDNKNINAKLENGILTIKIPNKVKAKKRNVIID